MVNNRKNGGYIPKAVGDSNSDLNGERPEYTKGYMRTRIHDKSEDGIFKCEGYSLVELSISLTIVALLITSGSSLFAKKSEIDRTKITKDRIAIIEQAIASYVDNYGFIPCPAKGSSVETDAYFGDSQTNASYNSSTHICSNNLTNNAGMVPVRNLGLEDKYAYDGWNRKFSFQVATGMGNALDFLDINYQGDIDVADSGGYNLTNRYRPSPNNYGAAYVIISFGQDGIGAWNKNSSTTPSTPSSSSIEYQNSKYLSNTNSLYIKDVSSSNFSHIVSFATKPMVSTTKLGVSPIKIPNALCDDAASIVNAGFPNGSGFSASLTGTVSSSASNTSLATQIYQSSMKLQKLCNNPPISSANSSSGCAFNPANISGLKLWLDGNDVNATGIAVSSGTTVSTWYDKSGNANNATSGTAGTATTLYEFPNSKTSVSFNGSTTWYNLPLTYLYNTNYTIFIVESLQSDYTTSTTSTNGIIGSNSLYIGYYYTSPSYYYNWTGNSGNNIASSQRKNNSVNIPSIWVVNFQYGASAGSVPQTLYVRLNDGTYSSASAYLAGSSLYLTNVNGTLGRSAVPNYYKGNIAEVLIYNVSLSPSNSKAVEGYLARKWFSGECP